TETAREGPIGDHVRYLLAQAQAQTGDFDGARATAASVAERYRSSRLAPRALLLATTFALRVGDDAQAQTLLGRLVDRYPDGPERIATETRESVIALRALRVVADGARKLGRYEAAARTLAEAVTHAPAAERPALQLERGKLLVRAGQPQKALVALDGAVTGGDADVAEAFYQRARILDDLDRRAEAATAYRAVIARYPSREVGAASLWRLGWLAWLAGDARGAAGEWTRLTERGVDRGYRIVALYWAGRARAQQGDGAVAEQL